MKRTMAAVIVGPTIGSSVSVFASERKRCGTAAKANWQTIEAIKAESGCFDMGTVDKNGARLEHYSIRKRGCQRRTAKVDPDTDTESCLRVLRPALTAKESRLEPQ
jgi:hypothetical protein